jgi:hypothetical protein
MSVSEDLMSLVRDLWRVVWTAGEDSAISRPGSVVPLSASWLYDPPLDCKEVPGCSGFCVLLIHARGALRS